MNFFYKALFYSARITLVMLAQVSLARAGYYGRMTSGGFFSKEVFRSQENDRYNDVFVLSQRLFISVDKLGDTNNEFIFDVRDKHDFFDKLDAERLSLTSSNKFQVYQMSLRNGGDHNGIKYQAGRFSTNEAGSLFVDGMDIGFRTHLWGLSNKISFFGGFNPINDDQSELTLNTKAKVYGVYDVLESKTKEWDKYFYFSNSFVRETYLAELDRFYFFNNTIIQVSEDENFTSMLYLDLDPKISIQNWWSSYITKVFSNYRLRSTLSTIDSLNYKRIQDIREVLASSRYHQISFSGRSPSQLDTSTYELKFTAGHRIIDQRNKLELKWGASVPSFLIKEVSGNISFGLRKNFVSKDAFGGLGIIHTNNIRELAINQDIVIEKRENDSMNLAFITDGSYTKFFSRNLFGVLALQNTWDKRVSIFSLLFKLSYRFGEGGQAPLRDGSPPMGQL